MKHQTLAMAADGNFDKFHKRTRRELFLSEMDRIVPWSKLVELIEPHYPKSATGRPRVGVERMLRVYFLQQWFNLSDAAAEESLYDLGVMRRFVSIDLGRERVPDETTICKFCHLLEKHGLGGEILDAVNGPLHDKGIRIATGTIVDATIIHAPSSTRNSTGQRDPEMHQTRKGNQGYFGLKAHVGVDSKTKLVHSVAMSAASVADCHMLPDLLHGDERKVWGDAAYQGQREVIEQAAPQSAGHDLPPHEV